MEHRNLSSTIEVTVLCGTRRGQPLQSLPSHIYHKSCDWFFNRKLGKLTYLGKCNASNIKFIYTRTFLPSGCAGGDIPSTVLKMNLRQQGYSVIKGMHMLKLIQHQKLIYSSKECSMRGGSLILDEFVQVCWQC